MDYYNQYYYYYGYYDSYYYGYRYGGGVTDYTFAQVDSDIIVYHPSPEYPEKIYAEEPKSDEKSGTREFTEDYQDENVTESLYIIDLSNPDKPIDIPKLTFETPAIISGLYSNGKTLYLTHYEDNSYYDENYKWHYEMKYYISKLDLSNPYEPNLIDPINIPGSFLGTNDVGTVVYTQSSEYDESYNWHQTLNVLQLSNDKAILKSVLDLGTSYANIVVDDTTLFITYENYYYPYYLDDVMYAMEETDSAAPGV
jgi:hypothetical protein